MKDLLFRSIVKEGTFADRCAALVLSIEEKPLENIKSIDSLLELTSRRREDALFVCNHLLTIFTEIFLDLNGVKETLLEKKEIPEVKKRKEREIQTRFFNFLVRIEKFSVDPIEKIRRKAIEMLSTLLSSTSVYQRNVVSLLVRRFSDQTPDVASRASYVSAKITQKRRDLIPLFIQEMQNMIVRLEKKGIVYVLDFMNNVEKSEEIVELAFYFLSSQTKAADQYQEKLNLRFLKVVSIHSASVELLSNYKNVLFRFAFGNVVNIAIEALKSIRRLSRRDSEVKMKMHRVIILLMVNKETWKSKQRKSFLALLQKELSRMEKGICLEMERNIVDSCFFADSEYSFGSLQLLLSLNRKERRSPGLKGMTRHYNPVISNLARKIFNGEGATSFDVSSLSEYSAVSILERIIKGLGKKE